MLTGGCREGRYEWGICGAHLQGEGGSVRGNKEQLERRLHPQNWSLSAILAMCLGTRTHLCGSARSTTAKARAPGDEQSQEGSLCGRRASAALCHPQGQSSPCTPHSPSPQHSTVLPSRCAGPLPAMSPCSRTCARSSKAERSQRCSMELGCARKPLQDPKPQPIGSGCCQTHK